MNCDSVELVPAVESGLNLGGIIGAENVLGDGAAIDQSGGAALEGDTLHNAVGIRSGLNRVGIGVGEIGDTESLDILCGIGIDILQNVVGLGQEHIDLVIGSGAVLIHQGFVELLLVGAVVTGGDDPVDGYAFGNGVVLLKEALELFVPGVDVEDFTLVICESGAAADGEQREDHNECKCKCDDLFHGFLLFNNKCFL